MRNDLNNLDPSDERHSCLAYLLQTHKATASKEHGKNRTALKAAREIYDDRMQHIVFDLFENTLFPKMVKQPSQLYFVTRLKFDLMGIHDSNRGSRLCMVFQMEIGPMQNCYFRCIYASKLLEGGYHSVELL